MITWARELLGSARMSAHAYVIGEQLGVGGMGRVHATRNAGNECVAIKLLHENLASDPAMRQRLHAEARSAQRVSHRNVIRVLDHGTMPDGTPFLVMEHARGISLGELVDREGVLPLTRIRRIAKQVLAGLAAIHHAGLVHGDMKSDNVLVDVERDDHVTIIDFGLARPPATYPVAADEHMLSGTPEYIAPEVIRGEPITESADLYAVGMIVYEMLTGATPFGGATTPLVFEQHLTDDVVPPSLRCPDRQIPPAFEHVVMRAVAKAPRARHRTAFAFAAAIERTLSAMAVEPSLPRTTTASSHTETEDWTMPITRRNLPHMRRRFAEASQVHDSAAVRHRRDELREAQLAGDPDSCIVGYLALVEGLLEERRLADAARELEVGIAWLGLAHPDATSKWRLLLSLAAIYDGLGDPDRALRNTLDARASAQREGCEVGHRRATSLLRRLDAARARARSPQAMPLASR